MFGLDIAMLLKSVLVAIVFVFFLSWYSLCVNYSGGRTYKHKFLLIVFSLGVGVFITVCVYVIQASYRDGVAYWNHCADVGGTRIILFDRYLCVDLEKFKSAEKLLNESMIKVVPND